MGREGCCKYDRGFLVGGPVDSWSLCKKRTALHEAEMEEVQEIQSKFRRSVLLGHVDLHVPRSSINLEGVGNPASYNSHL